MPSIPNQSTPSLSPHVRSNASILNSDIAPSPYTNVVGTHSTSAASNLEEHVLLVDDRPLIQPIWGE